MSNHPHQFNLAGTGRSAFVPARPLPSSSSTSSSKVPPTPRGHTANARQVVPVDPADRKHRVPERPDTVPREAERPTGGLKRGRDDSERERQIATVSGQDKKSKASSLAATRAKAFVDHPGWWKSAGVDVGQATRHTIAAALADPGLDLEAVACALVERLGIQDRVPAIDGVLAAWAEWSLGKGEGEQAAVRSAARQLMGGLATAIKGDDAQRFDRAVVAMVSRFFRSPDAARLSHPAGRFSHLPLYLVQAARSLLRSNPAATDRLLDVTLADWCTAFGHLGNQAFMLGRLVADLLEAPGGRARHREVLRTVVLKNQAKMTPDFVGAMLRPLADAPSFLDDAALVGRVLEAPGLDEPDKGLALMIAADARLDDMLEWRKLNQVLPSEAEVPDGAIGAILDAAQTPARRILALNCLLAARWAHHEAFRELTVEISSPASGRGAGNRRVAGLFHPRVDAALRRGISGVAAACSQAQLTELAHRLAQVDPVPDPVTDREAFVQRVQSLAPPVPARQAEGKAVERQADHEPRRQWIAAGLRLPALDAAAVARLDHLAPQDQARLFLIGLSPGEGLSDVEWEQVFRQLREGEGIPAALKAAIVLQALHADVLHLNPPLLREGRQRYLAESLEAIRQVVAREPLAERRDALWEIELSKPVEQLTVLYRNYLHGRGKDGLLKSPRPLAQPLLEIADTLIRTLQDELLELMDHEKLWARAQGSLGLELRRHIRELRQALDDQGATSTTPATSTTTSTTTSASTTTRPAPSVPSSSSASS